MRARKIIRRTLWTLLALITLVALFYAEENWRGARAWRETEQQFAKAGESLDYRHFIPPPIPDDQNLGALPVFALEPLSKTDSFPSPNRLKKALREDRDESLPLPTSLGIPDRGHLPDIPAIRRAIAQCYVIAFKSAPAPRSSMEQLDSIYPLLPELRAASATRTRCRFDGDYNVFPPDARPLSLITYQIKIAKLLTIEGLLALDERRPDVALEDLRTMYTLALGAGLDPSLVGGLVSIGVNAIANSLVTTGLALRAWNDDQLAQLEAHHANVNMLETYHADLRAEAAASASTFQAALLRPATLGQSLRNLFEGAPSTRFLLLWPSGWWNELRAHVVLADLRFLGIIDARQKRVYPESFRTIWNDIQNPLEPALPWRTLLQEWIGPLETTPYHFAKAQTLIDQTVVACALERYRLARGKYPDTLAELQPDFCATLPHDVINGEPLHYRVLPEGGYLLYSVGQNEKDDNGTIVYHQPGSGFVGIDYSQGDWVWFGAK